MERWIRRGRTLHLRDEKNTKDMETTTIPLPEKVMVQLATYGVTGADCLVAKGDFVKLGTKLAAATGALGVPVYSPVSGKVEKVDYMTTAMGHRSPYVTIKVEGEEEEAFQPPVVTDRASFLAAVRESGIVGLGGAGFPAFCKLSTGTKPVRDLLINGAECEPYITSDYREMMENTEQVVRGIKSILEYIGAERAILCIEDNKPEAIKKLTQWTEEIPNVSVKSVATAYPGGAEKMVMLHTIGKTTAPGQIPIDLGAVVINVSTVSEIQRYLDTGRPMTHRRVTVDGSAVKNKGNYRVPIGTPVAHLLSFAKAENVATILMGGPMMGIALPNDSYPIVANNNGILAFTKGNVWEESPCIRCGRCAAVCPIRLLPAEIDRGVRRGDIQALEELKVMACMECGCCSYVCPAHRRLVQTNRMGKQAVRGKGKK